MILTCPACDTKYVVKDGAIPPAGRQVRCASCKHSWHQDPEAEVAEIAAPPESDIGGPPLPEPDAYAVPFAEVPAEAEAEAMIADTPKPVVEDQAGWNLPQDPYAAPAASNEGPSDYVSDMPVGTPVEPQAAPASDWQNSSPPEEEFLGYSPIGDDEERARRRWPLILGLLILIAAAAAVFWFYAPTEWKARAGIAQAGATPLQLMITTSDRQPLESGNELVAISGRVINPTDQTQKIPPIRAELRDKQTQAVVHRWTIDPPAQVLAPRSSASFNSAEIDVPKGGDVLTVTLGG